MKRYLFFILMLSICLLSNSQEKFSEEEQKSNIESFSEKTGTIFIKTYIDIDKWKKAEFQVLIIKDIIKGSKITGLLIKKDVYSSYSSDTKRAFLDSDEVDDLITTIDFFETNILDSIPFNYTEAYLKCRDGFEFGSYFSDGEWKLFMKLEKHDSDSYIRFKISDLIELKKILSLAKISL